MDGIALETAARDFAKLRIDRANAKMNAKPEDTEKPEDPVARLRMRADNMAATSAAMKKIADAADPLYQTLDEGQKHRLAFLTHRGGHGGGGGEGWHQRGRDRGGEDRDPGFGHGERGFGGGWDGPERL